MKNKLHTTGLLRVFIEFQKIPKGILIDNPDEKIKEEFVVGEMFIIVTSFVTDKKYLKNFEILWRTGTSSS